MEGETPDVFHLDNTIKSTRESLIVQGPNSLPCTCHHSGETPSPITGSSLRKKAYKHHRDVAAQRCQTLCHCHQPVGLHRPGIFMSTHVAPNAALIAMTDAAPRDHARFRGRCRGWGPIQNARQLEVGPPAPGRRETTGVPHAIQRRMRAASAMPRHGTAVLECKRHLRRAAAAQSASEMLRNDS
jgi:hypothetical protein